MGKIIYVSQKDFKNLTERTIGEILFNKYGCQPLIGGLDHIEKTKNQCIIYDIGKNNKCNDYIVRIKK